MHQLEEYAQSGIERYERVKREALGAHRENLLTREMLKAMLKEAFNAGHYTGHCRGEMYVKRRDQDAI